MFKLNYEPKLDVARIETAATTKRDGNIAITKAIHVCAFLFSLN